MLSQLQTLQKEGCEVSTAWSQSGAEQGCAAGCCSKEFGKRLSLVLCDSDAAISRSPNELWVSTKAARGAVSESVKLMGIWSRLGKAQEGKSKTEPKEFTIKCICGFY